MIPFLEWSGAVVDGSEFPSPEGRAQARALSEGFAMTNVTVIGSADNGLGVEAVLSAVRHGGAAILIARNSGRKELEDEIIAGGGAVVRVTTEYQAYSMQNDDEFAKCVAAFGQTVIVPEADDNPASTAVARAAHLAGQQLVVVRPPSNSSAYAGNISLSSLQGARVMTGADGGSPKLTELTAAGRGVEQLLNAPPQCVETAHFSSGTSHSAATSTAPRNPWDTGATARAQGVQPERLAPSL